MRVLALSGSLRAESANRSLLEAASLISPPDLQIEMFAQIGLLPHFNPDLDGELQDKVPHIISKFREDVARADGLLISCPEYARGIPGSFKNALDWLVGSESFFEKPVALFNASPRAQHAKAALRLVLETMSARVIEEASIELPLLARGMDASAIANDPEMGPLLAQALTSFRNVLAREAERRAGTL